MLSVRSEASELRYQTTESNGTFFLESERERERERERVFLSQICFVLLTVLLLFGVKNILILKLLF